MKEYVEFAKDAGFSGVKFTRLYANGQVCQMEFKDFDPRRVRDVLGRPVKHNENLFAFKVSRSQMVRVNTKIGRMWLGNGKHVATKILESIK